MSKNILVSERLLCDVYRLIYFLDPATIPDEVRHLCLSIEAAIDDKIHRSIIHNAFTAYKTAPPGTEREALRLEYVRLSQIHRSFISCKELPYSSL